MLDLRFCLYSKVLLREHGKPFPDGRVFMVHCRSAAR